jgi:hypothetical protein
LNRVIRLIMSEFSAFRDLSESLLPPTNLPEQFLMQNAYPDINDGKQDSEQEGHQEGRMASGTVSRLVKKMLKQPFSKEKPEPVTAPKHCDCLQCHNCDEVFLDASCTCYDWCKRSNMIYFNDILFK